jgi:hypothetical protein
MQGLTAEGQSLKGTGVWSFRVSVNSFGSVMFFTGCNFFREGVGIKCHRFLARAPLKTGADCH